MRKIDKSLSKKYPPVKLYKDDLEKLLELFITEGFDNLKFTTEEYEYTSEEFFNLNNEKITNLKITANNPFYFSIYFEDNWIRIYTNSDWIKELWLIQKIELIIKQKTRVIAFYLLNSVTIYFASIIITILILIILMMFLKNSNINEDTIKSFIYLAMLLIYVFISLIWYSLNKSFLKNIFILDYKKNYPNFWKRNKDQLFTGITMVIIGFLLWYFIK